MRACARRQCISVQMLCNVILAGVFELGGSAGAGGLGGWFQCKCKCTRAHACQPIHEFREPMHYMLLHGKES